MRRMAQASRPFLEAPPEGFVQQPILSPRGCLTVGRREQAATLASIATGRLRAMLAAAPGQHFAALRNTAQQAESAAPVQVRVSVMPMSDAAPGTVVQVLQRGYKSGDRLLRPALVVVAKAKSAE